MANDLREAAARAVVTELRKAWSKYVALFGEQPHGTAKQMAALATFMDMEALRSALDAPALDRDVVLEVAIADEIRALKSQPAAPQGERTPSIRCNCNWDEGHEPTCNVVKSHDRLKQPPAKRFHVHTEDCHPPARWGEPVTDELAGYICGYSTERRKGERRQHLSVHQPWCKAYRSLSWVICECIDRRTGNDRRKA